MTTEVRDRDTIARRRRDREATARRLLKASEARSWDPNVDVDWDAPLPDGVTFLPEHQVSLYGTALWERMSPQQRIDLSRHEVASMASVGIWFELILMQLLVRHMYDLDPRTAHVQYGLTELADECRHSVMFGRLLEKLGCPAYGPGQRAHTLGRLMKTTASGPESFAAILIAEEILDTFQREAMADRTIQPIIQQVSRLHVAEEARHVTYAREELVRQWERTSGAGRALARLVVAREAQVIAGRLIHPDAYAAVGLDPQEARQAAKASPHRAETLRWAGERLVTFFTELGLIDATVAPIWRRARLLA